MSPLVKALLAFVLVVPLVAYVAGSLGSHGGGAPERQGTVFIDDMEPARDTPSERETGPETSPASPQRTPEPPPGEEQKEPSGEVRVVTPAPVGNDDDDDDDDERDDDRDDTDDGDDTGD